LGEGVWLGSVFTTEYFLQYLTVAVQNNTLW